jgi:hypothetical protein
VSLQSAQDSVRIAVGRAKREADEVEFGGRHAAYRRTVLAVVAGGEHLRRVDRDPHRSTLRALAQLLELSAGGIEHEDWLNEERQVTEVVRVQVVLSDRLGRAAAVTPLIRKAAALSRCQTARSSRTTSATLVSKSPTPMTEATSNGGNERTVASDGA